MKICVNMYRFTLFNGYLNAIVESGYPDTTNWIEHNTVVYELTKYLVGNYFQATNDVTAIVICDCHTC